MPETILAVEYEPRYIERIRQALSALPFAVVFAKDGAEALAALSSAQGAPRLIVLSSVIPKMSTLDLIREIRGREAFKETPILLTVSGYTGKSPAADAQRIGASDLLAKPYAEPDLLAKVQQVLGIPQIAPAPVEADPHQFTSNEIFGDIVDGEPAAAQGRKLSARAEANLDKMLADTLADVMPAKKAAPQPAASRPADRPRTQPGGAELDKLVSDTLSGLERSSRKVGGGTSPGVAVRPAATAPPATPPPVTPIAAPKAAVPAEANPAPAVEAVAVETPLPDRVPVSQPILAPEKEGEVAGASGNFGQYELAEKIATGGMAEVWKARMLGVEGFQKIVAIKKILPHLSDNRDFIEMFVDEAKLAAQLNHNNITHIYDLGKLQNSYYIAMEYIDGYDLKTILHRAHERGEPMSVELALFIASKVAAALDYAHRKRDFEDREMGIVHRDVSPQNVLISQEGDIKLCDFGIAKAASKASHTQAGALKGKLQYMSPEQAWGRPIDRRSDVFALGSVLFEMLTGTKLFSGESEMSVLDQVREALVRKPSDVNDEVPPEVDALLMSALAKDPAERYQSAGEMARDIDAILYSFKPTPTSADLAIYLDRLWAPAAEPAPMPQAAASFDAPRAFSDVMSSTPPVIVGTPAAIVTTPVVARMPEPIAPVAAATSFREPEPEKKKSPLVFAGIAAGVLAVAIGVAVVFMGGKEEPAGLGNGPVAQSTSAAVLPATATIPATASTTVAGTVAPATETAIDPTMVDREVQRRLAAERARLEQQARPQTQTSAPEPARAAAQSEPPPQTATRAEPQVTQVTQTVPPPQAPPPTATVAESRPEPPAATPQPQRAREGDLVPSGTPGLAPPRLLRRGVVPYPQMAKMQRVEGTVIVNVLVSETGGVLETRLVRGINRPVGLNEAAELAMRRSTFAPATKDGVRVRSWLSVPVEFKL